MSKLYKNYVMLKIQNPDKIYLFECGIFYIFIHTDAEIMSKELGLKLTSLNSLIPKCGFPVNSSDKYFNLLKNLNYNVEIVPANSNSSTELNEYITSQKYDAIVSEFLALNIDDLSISEAFEYLRDLQNKFKELQTLSDNNAK